MDESDFKTFGSRKPTQDRSRERVARMLAAAETLLKEHGPENTSIPDIANLSGLPRSSVYQFFPTKYAVFLAIADHHLGVISSQIKGLSDVLEGSGLDEVVGIALRATVDYYNDSVVASMLILGGPMSRNGFRSLEVTNRDIGNQVRAIMAELQPDVVVPAEPDVMTIAVEIAFGCMRHAYFDKGYISDEMVEQSKIAVLAYLRHHAPFR